MKPRLYDILRLVRIPTVFTAMADILLGYSLTHQQVRFEPSFWLLLGSSTLLYWSGMIWNDVFDVEQDRVERPNRPIPSGAVSLALAKSLGVGCMLAGVLLAALVPTSGKSPFAVSVLAALAVIVFVLAYDGPGKRTRVGPLLMGLCRGGNVMLGASHFP